MIKIKIAGFVLISFLLCQCGVDQVRFEVPQPEGQRDEKAITKKMMGVFLSLSDSSRLIVNKNSILRKTGMKETVPLSEFLSDIDSADWFKFNKDTSFSTLDTLGSILLRRNFHIDKQRVTQTLLTVDTVFVLHKDVIRKFKGYYFLNHNSGLNNWNVIKLGITNEGLVMGRISTKEDLNQLRELTNTQSDTIYNFKPSRKQMKKFLKENGFRSEERFVKIKESTFD